MSESVPSHNRRKFLEVGLFGAVSLFLAGLGIKEVVDNKKIEKLRSTPPQHYPNYLPENVQTSGITSEVIDTYLDKLDDATRKELLECCNEFIKLYKHKYSNLSPESTNTLKLRFFSLFVCYEPNFEYKDKRLGDDGHGGSNDNGLITYRNNDRAIPTTLADSLFHFEDIPQYGEIFQSLSRSNFIVLMQEIAHSINGDQAIARRSKLSVYDQTKSQHEATGLISQKQILYGFPDYLEYQAHRITLPVIFNLYLFTPIESNPDFAVIYNNIFKLYRQTTNLYTESVISRESAIALHNMFLSERFYNEYVLNNKYQITIEFIKAYSLHKDACIKPRTPRDIALMPSNYYDLLHQYCYYHLTQGTTYTDEEFHQYINLAADMYTVTGLGLPENIKKEAIDSIRLISVQNQKLIDKFRELLWHQYYQDLDQSIKQLLDNKLRLPDADNEYQLQVHKYTLQLQELFTTEAGR